MSGQMERLVRVRPRKE